MSVPGVEISAVKSGGELLGAWRGFESEVANMHAWPEAVEAGRNDVLVARKIGRVAGFVTIRWAGVHPREPEFLAVVTERYPHEMPPAIYLLFVHEQYRRQGIARALMTVAEQRIVERPDTVRRAVLSVRQNNQPAINLYESLGYEHLGGVIVDIPKYDEAAGIHVSEIVTSLAMAKDLSRTGYKS